MIAKLNQYTLPIATWAVFLMTCVAIGSFVVSCTHSASVQRFGTRDAAYDAGYRDGAADVLGIIGQDPPPPPKRKITTTRLTTTSTR